MTEVKLVPVHSGGAVVGYALVDADDYERIAKRRWSFNSGRARRRGPTVDGRQSTIYMHREVMGLAAGDSREVDHRNFNQLDNRRSNLRVVTHAENHQNRRADHNADSEFRGVHFDRRSRKWVAQVGLLGERHYIGRFATEIEADEAARAWRAEHMPLAEEAAA